MRESSDAAFRFADLGKRNLKDGCRGCGIRSLECEELPRLLQREAEFLSRADEVEPIQVGIPVKAVASGSPIRS